MHRTDDYSPIGSLTGHVISDPTAAAQLDVINYQFRKVMFRKKINGQVGAVSFSPCGNFFVVTKHKDGKYILYITQLKLE